MEVLFEEKFPKKYLDEVKNKAQKFIDEGHSLPMGFYGLALFNLGTIVCDENVEKLLEKSPKFIEQIKDCLEKFKKDDWGDISEEIAYECNTEARYMGTGMGMIALYETPEGFLRVDTVGVKNGKDEKWSFYTHLTISKEKSDVYKESDEANYAYNDAVEKMVTEFHASQKQSKKQTKKAEEKKHEK